MAETTIDQRRLFHRAQFLRNRAAGTETAAGGRVDGAGRVALQHDPLSRALELRVGLGHGREQRLRVRVCRGGVDFLGRADLMILPRYITAITSLMWRTTDRSWAMNR